MWFVPRSHLLRLQDSKCRGGRVGRDELGLTHRDKLGAVNYYTFTLVRPLIRLLD
jgi:hypothetical protein